MFFPLTESGIHALLAIFPLSGIGAYSTVTLSRVLSSLAVPETVKTPFTSVLSSGAGELITILGYSTSIITFATGFEVSSPVLSITFAEIIALLADLSRSDFISTVQRIRVESV